MLSQFLVTELFAFFFVFCRLGSALMLLPGFGEFYVSVRIRLLLALVFSLVVAAALNNIPPLPADLFSLVNMLLAEIIIGIFIGGVSRLLIVAIQFASMIIAFQSSLASALTQDVTAVQSQSTSVGNLLGLTALVLLFTTDLHHVMLRGLVDSYTLFLPGQFPPIADFAQHVTRSVNDAFSMSIQLAAPHIVIGLIIYLAAGIISRLMPNMQVFFILMAPQLLISFIILMLSIGAIMTWYMEYFRAGIIAFLSP